MARRFSLFRRSEPEEAAETPAAAAGETTSKGFGFVTYADPPEAGGDPDQPVIVGSVPNTDAPGGNDVAVESISIVHEGFEPASAAVEPRMEIYGFSHEVTSPRDAASEARPVVIGGLWNGEDGEGDAAAPGETIQIHGQYDMDTTVESDAGPFAMEDAAGDAPSASASLFPGEIVAIEPGFDATGQSEDLADDAVDDLL